MTEPDPPTGDEPQDPYAARPQDPYAAVPPDPYAPVPYVSGPYVAGLDTPLTPDQQQSADHRRRAIVILSAVVAVALVIVAIAAVALVHNSKPKATHTSTSHEVDPAGSPPAADVLNHLASVPASTLSEVGRGLSAVTLKSIHGPALPTGGKPTVLFVGAEFCPYCAAERWSMYQAFSRFGTFSGVDQIRSSEDDLATLDFAHATYTSKYFTFTPIELEGQNREPLATLTPTQTSLFSKYAQNSFPFLYFDGKYAQAGAGYSPELLTGLNQAQIVTLLGDPKNQVTQGIVGEANVLTAAACGLTNGQPASVCSNSAVSDLENTLNGTVAG